MGKFVAAGLLACLLAGPAPGETPLAPPGAAAPAGEDVVEIDFLQPGGAAAPGDPFGVPPGWGGGPGGVDHQQLQERMVQAVRTRTAGMTPAEMRRLLVLIEHESVTLPAGATEILDSYKTQAGAVQRDADKKIRQLRRAAAADLKELLGRLVKEGQLDEAIAVRAAMRAMMVPAVPTLPDPGSPGAYRGQNGRVLYFQVTGAAGNSVWGAGVYTDDSALATAAVHAGVLKPGQTGPVMVTILPGQASYEGSTQNGVTSSSYGAFSGSYRVDAAPTIEDEATPGDPAEAPPRGAPAAGSDARPDVAPPRTETEATR